VPGTRFELVHPFGRHPLKMVRLPISPPGLKGIFLLKSNVNKKSRTVAGYFSDFAGIRTQGPYIKSVLLYQLSYEIIAFFQKRLQKYKSFALTPNVYQSF